MPRPGLPCPEPISVALRAAIQRRGVRVVAERSGLSTIAIASAAAGSHVWGSTVARARAYLEEHEGFPRLGVAARTPTKAKR